MHLTSQLRKLLRSDGWRQQIGRQLRYRSRCGPRNLAVVTFVPRSKSKSKLIDIRRLAVCILYDEFSQFSSPYIRFAGYRLTRVPWGIALGGPERIVLDKDLATVPRRRAYGRRFASRGNHWLPLALRMDRILVRHARHPYVPRPTELRLPRFWVALNTQKVIGSGPEFAQLCQEYNKSADQALLTCSRCYRGETLYPLEFVSHLWRHFEAVYADLEHFFPRQVIRFDGRSQLTFFAGACECDLLSSSHRWRR